MSKKAKRAKFVFVEWREGDRYRGADYAEAEVLKVLASLRELRSRGINVHSVNVDDREVSL